MAISDRIAVMSAGEIQHIGTPKNIYQRPANLFVSTFIGRSNLIRGALRCFGDAVWLETAGGYRARMDNLRENERKDQDVILSVRPEEFLLHPEPSAGIEATVNDCVFLGLNTHYFLTLCSGEDAVVIQESSIGSTIAPGTRVGLTINMEKLNIFSEETRENLVEGVVNDCIR